MNRQQKQNEKGFTIIEVVLVLAIAALIFLMVFIALPALQESQRDSQRPQDLSRAQTALNQFQSNNRNQVPDAGDYDTELKDRYLLADSSNSTFEDPSRGEYNFVDGSDGGEPTYNDDEAQIFVTVGSVCDGEGLKDGASRNVAFRMALEGGGIACASN